jgi:hypothetical protein
LITDRPKGRSLVEESMCEEGLTITHV